jgi:ATP-dependent Clp protease protease subunit
MTLDADGDEPVTLRVDCAAAGLGPALTLMDVIELMGVPVHALCLGQVAGGAVGVLAVCAHRSAMPSTRLLLNEAPTHMEAHVRNVAQWAELRADERRRFCERVGAAVGHPAGEVVEDLERGRFFGAAEAVEYGLLDEVCRPDADIRSLRGSGPGSDSDSQRSSSSPTPPAPPSTPMGFRPLR